MEVATDPRKHPTAEGQRAPVRDGDDEERKDKETKKQAKKRAKRRRLGAAGCLTLVDRDNEADHGGIGRIKGIVEGIAAHCG